MNEADFTAPRGECPNPHHWTAEDDCATENEVIEGLYGLVRMLQPEYVIETGTHRGFAAEAMGRALQENGHGWLDTIEIDSAMFTTAVNRIGDLPVGCHLLDAALFQPRKQIDFAWIDSGSGEQRAKEFLAFLPHFHVQALVAFHDPGTHHSSIREPILELEAAGHLKPIFLRTPRGVALCQVLKK